MTNKRMFPYILCWKLEMLKYPGVTKNFKNLSISKQKKIHFKQYLFMIVTRSFSANSNTYNWSISTPWRRWTARKKISTEEWNKNWIFDKILMYFKRFVITIASNIKFFYYQSKYRAKNISCSIGIISILDLMDYFFMFS